MMKMLFRWHLPEEGGEVGGEIFFFLIVGGCLEDKGCSYYPWASDWKEDRFGSSCTDNHELEK
jgi:hypothetical protein